MKAQKRFKIEKKMLAVVKYYEELYVITDETGEKLYMGTKETADKYLKILNAQRRGKRK